MPSDREFEFTLDGLPVGYFEEPTAPSAPGRYRYMPYRGPGHLQMREEFDAGRRPRFCLRLGDRTILFEAVDCPKSKEFFLEIQRVQVQPPRSWPERMRLADVFERAATRALAEGWLFLPQDDTTWSAESESYVFDDDDFAELANEARKCGLRCTVDTATLEDILRAARTHLGIESFAGRLEAFTYYHRYDAPLPRIGAPDPTGAADARLRRDREFFDKLGAERSESPCRKPGCARGAIAQSVLCRVHHFEQVLGRACPFQD